MNITKATLNWFPKSSPYDALRADQEKRKAYAEDFIATQNNVANALAGISSDNISQQGDLTARAAATRLNVKL